MYRPEGMKENPYNSSLVNPEIPEYSELSMHEAYEAGADAYEKGLKKEFKVELWLGEDGCCHCQLNAGWMFGEKTTKIGIRDTIPEEKE